MLPARPKAAAIVCVCLSFSLASSSDSAAASATAAAAAAATAETAELWTKPLPPAADGNLTASAAVAVLNREALRVVSQESVPALRFALSEIPGLEHAESCDVFDIWDPLGGAVVVTKAKGWTAPRGLRPVVAFFLSLNCTTAVM
jgi:hypothetical protein